MVCQRITLEKSLTQEPQFTHTQEPQTTSHTSTEHHPTPPNSATQNMVQQNVSQPQTTSPNPTNPSENTPSLDQEIENTLKVGECIGINISGFEQNVREQLLAIHENQQAQ